jgi:DNA-binding transcriptional ArsR family regulator
MNVKPWVKINNKWILSGGLSELKWVSDELGKPSDKLAALIIYIALAMFSTSGSTTLTYNRLSELTGLSRDLISRGTKVLLKIGLITVERVGRNNKYTIIYDVNGGGWCKLPGRPLMMKADFIKAFSEIKLRSKSELHAIKLFLYFAAVRDNKRKYTMASFKKINKATGIPEKDITKARSLLVVWGILVQVDTEKKSNGKINEPNKYYLAGYSHLVKNNDKD